MYMFTLFTSITVYLHGKFVVVISDAVVVVVVGNF